MAEIVHVVQIKNWRRRKMYSYSSMTGGLPAVLLFFFYIFLKIIIGLIKVFLPNIYVDLLCLVLVLIIVFFTIV